MNGQDRVLDESLASLGLALARDDVALWLGPDWEPSAGVEVESLAQQRWLAIWSESRDTTLAQTLRKTQQGSGRLLVEVPDRIEAVLGTHYRLSEIQPYFFLQGSGAGPDSLPEAKRRRARDAKIDQLAQLKQSYLLVAGHRDSVRLRAMLEEITEAAPDLKVVVFWQESKPLLDSEPGPAKRRFHIVLDGLQETLGLIRERRARLPSGPSVRVGDRSVPLLPLLLTQPPLDEDFIILTEQQIREPEQDEDETAILHEILSGVGPPWRALAHGKAWNRQLSHRGEIRRLCEELTRPEGKLVMCVNIPAEAGSGLSMLLQQIAFDAARAGYPTLLHRGLSGRLQYDFLRHFLSKLQKERTEIVPTVIIFDAQFAEMDTQNVMRDVPLRLAQDRLPVLVVRGLPAWRDDLHAGNSERERVYRKQHGVRTRSDVVNQRWLAALSSRLDPEARDELADWATRTFGMKAEGGVTAVRNWTDDDGGVPLLICLYFVLREDLRSAAGLGRHLFERLLRRLQSGATQPMVPLANPERPLSQAEIDAALPGLAQQLKHNAVVGLPPSPDDCFAVLLILAALGWLRISISRTLLASFTELPERIPDILGVLGELDLIALDRPYLQEGSHVLDQRAGGAQAPRAFYEHEERIGMRHAAYGRLLLEWTYQTPPDRLDRLATRDLDWKLLEAAAEPVDEAYPLNLLEPIFRRLQPNSAHVEFASEVTTRFLRLQKHGPDSRFTRWQWKHPEVLLAAFTWINEQVIRQSSTLLHSRAMTLYKSCFSTVPIDECRNRYRKAERDLIDGIELARQGVGNEHPANLVTSLGLLYLGWADRERGVGNQEKWCELDRQVEATLRRGLKERRDNPFAAFGLAQYLNSRCRRTDVKAPTNDEALTAYSEDLAEALDLLQGEPEAYFEHDWNDVKKDVIKTLHRAHALRVIEQLKQRRDALGYALEALHLLDGQIPTELVEKDEAGRLQAAAAVLAGAEQVPGLKRRGCGSF